MSMNKNIAEENNEREAFLANLLTKYTDPALTKLLDLNKIGAVQMPLAMENIVKGYLKRTEIRERITSNRSLKHAKIKGKIVLFKAATTIKKAPDKWRERRLRFGPIEKHRAFTGKAMTIGLAPKKIGSEFEPSPENALTAALKEAEKATAERR